MRAFLAFLFLVSTFAQAQPPRGFFPWWESPLTRDLNLTEEQSRQFQSVMRDFRTQMIDQRAALEKAEAEVEDLFNEDPIDERKANEATDRLVAARGALTRSLTLMSLKLRSVLTAAQWRELQRRRSDKPAHRPGMRPMGPGSRPGRPGAPSEPRRPPPPAQM